MPPTAYSVDTLGLPPRDSRVKDPAATRSLALAVETMRRDPPGYPTDDRRNVAAHYKGLPYLCIQLIAEGMAGASVRVTQRKPKKRVVAATADRRLYKSLPTPHSQADDEEWVPAPEWHPLCRLFEEVNEAEDTLSDFLTDWTVNEELYGEAVIWPVPDRTGYPRELYVVPTFACHPVLPGFSDRHPCGALRVWGWQAGMAGLGGPSGGQFELDNRDIIRPRKRHHMYRWAGYSPLTAGANELDQLESISEARKKHMDAGFAPEVVIGVSGASITELERLRAQYEGRFLGSKGQRVLFTDGESVDIDSSGRGAREMDYPAGWDQMVKFVSAFWRTGSSVLGLTEADSYAAFYAKLQQHHTLCLGPRAKSKGEVLTRRLARRFWPRDRLRVEVDLPRIDDRQELRAWAGLKLGDLYTYNEARALQNLDPVGPEGDVPPSVYLAQLTGQQQQQLTQAGIAAGLLPDPTKVPETPGGGGPQHGPGGRFVGGGPPRPDNPDGAGSLPPKAVAKSLRKILKSLPG